MALGGGKVTGFQRVEPSAVRGEEVRRTKLAPPDGKPAEVALSEITPEQAKTVLARAGADPRGGVFGRTAAYQTYARAVDEAVAEKLDELKGLLPSGRLTQMEEWIKRVMYDNGRVVFRS